MATPHIGAERGDFADVCLLPGDPLRAKHIADTFLENAVEVNSVRNMLGYTGIYQGRRVSTMGTGMGIPSASIYAKELITEYDVTKLIRVGSCGGIRSDVGIRDIIIAMGACTDSGVNRSRFRGLDYSAIADYQLLRAVADAAETHTASHGGNPVRVGNVFSADLFYHPDFALFDTMEAMGVMAVEMEAAGLYGVSAEYGAQAVAIMTVSDHVRTGEATSAEERQSTFNDMIEIALAAVVGMD